MKSFWLQGLWLVAISVALWLAQPNPFYELVVVVIASGWTVLFILRWEIKQLRDQLNRIEGKLDAILTSRHGLEQ